MITRLVVAALLAPLSCGQEVLWERDGVSGKYKLGIKSVVGDLDQDGWDDLAVIVDDIELPARPQFQIWLLSGRDGSTLRVSRELDTFHRFLHVVGVGDMSGDGVPDYAYFIAETSGFGEEVMEVVSGADDACVWRIVRSQNTSVGPWLGGLDLNADGKPDLIARGGSTVNGFVAFDHAGHQLYEVRDRAEFLYYLGQQLDSLGDLDGDGADEWVAGILAGPATGAAVHSGRTGEVLVVALKNTSDSLGKVAAAGDLDGDGVQDFYVGAVFGGGVAAFSGRTGQEIRYTYQASEVGEVFATDLDGDGVKDAIVDYPGMPVRNRPGQFGRVFAFSGRDGSVLWDHGVGGFGGAGGRLREATRHPFPVFWTGMLGPDDVGRVRVYRATPFRTRPYGSPCPGGLPATTEIGLRDFAQSGGVGVRVHLSGAPAGVCTCFVLGFSDTEWNGVPLPLALSFLGLPGCGLYTSIEHFAPRVTGTVGPDRGYAYVDFPWPQAGLFGRFVYGQWLIMGPDNTWPGGLTRALTWPAFWF